VGIGVETTEAQRQKFKEVVVELTKTTNLDLIGYVDSLTLKSFEKELNKLAVDYDLIFIDNL